MEEIELIGKRKPREKHFLQKDGTIIAKVYDTDIHFLKNGLYEEIDNTLIKNGELLENKNNNFKVEFEETLNKYLMKMKKDNNYLNIRLSDCNHARIITEDSSSKLEQSVFYEDVMDDISIQYKTLPNKVKETIVLKSNKYSKINFVAETNLNLVMEDKCIIATKNGEKVFELEAPYMEDSEGKVNNNVYYRLIEHEDHYDVELNLDSNWLNSLDVKYPVYVDPTISNVNQSHGWEDTYIYSGDTNVDRNSQMVLKAGVEKVDGKNRINRTLVKFDLPEIGTGSEVIAAYLTFIGYPIINKNCVNDSKLIALHRVTKNWSESSANWNSMNMAFDSKVEAVFESKRSEVSDNIISPYLIGGDITNLVKKWYVDLPNYGILIKSVSEEYIDDNYPSFFSKDNGFTENPRPYFTIVYRNHNGYEDYLDYKKQDLSCGSFFTNTYNGNLTGNIEVGKTIGGPISTLLELIYNTNDVVLNKQTNFGKGYKLSLEQTLKEVKIDNIDYLEYIDSDGTIHYFYKDIYNNAYMDEEGLDLSIKQEENNYLLADNKNNKLLFTKFSDIYRLTKMIDSNENYIDIEIENNKIVKILDNFGSVINIVYNDDKIIITSSNNVTIINFENNKISTIKNNVGTIKIDYNDKELISQVTDTNELKIVYCYYENSPYRMKKVTNYSINNNIGQEFELHYGHNLTRIIDNKGNVETIIYNSSGNVESRNSLKTNDDIDNAYSITKEYNEFTSQNKLSTSSIPVTFIKNYLKNSSFEEDDDYFSENINVIKEITEEISVSGNKSLKLSSSLNDQFITREVSVEKGEYYTFSGSFKSNKDIEIILLYNDSTGNEIKQTSKVRKSDHFVREDVSIFYEEEASSNLSIKINMPLQCTVYVDDIQLEKGDIANMYNLIENGDFSEGIGNWELSATNEKNVKVPNDMFKLVNFNNDKNIALKVEMNPNISTSFSRKYSIKGKIGELYTISFWYKNEGIPACRPYAGNTVTVFFEPVDDPENNDYGHCIVSSPNFNSNDDSWQYFSYRVRSLEDFKSINVIFNQDTQANNFYITNISLYKNITSGEYNYDDLGNVIKISSQTGKENIFKYDCNNQLISSTTPRGKNFKFEYDNKKTDKVLNAISSMGISNTIEYDNLGNAIKTKISKNISDTIENGNYKIRCKGEKKYLKSELYTIIAESNDCSNTIWKIRKENDIYKIYNSILENFYMAYHENSIILSQVDENNEFILEANDNKSYHIIVQLEENNKKYVKKEGNVFVLKDLDKNDPTFEFYIEDVNSLFIETSSTYSEDGKFVTSVTDSNLNKVFYETDENTGLLKSITNAKNTTEYSYNNKGNISSVKIGNMNCQYSYNSNNMLNKITLGNKEYFFYYDEFLKPKSVYIGNSLKLMEFEYENNDGNMNKITYGNNNQINMEYDSFEKLSSLIKMDKKYDYRYDNNGNVAKIITEDYEEKYKYDEENRLFNYKNTSGFEIDYTFDENDNTVEKKYYLTDPIVTINNTYNKDDMLLSTSFNNNTIYYTYDELNRLNKKSILGLYDTNIEYVTNGNRTSTLISSFNNNGTKTAYKYDELNNITEIYHNNAIEKKYYYDDYNQLVREDNYNSGDYIEYSYDNYGNILRSKKKNIENDCMVKENIYQYQNSIWGDQLTSFNNNNIEYDEIGNMTQFGSNLKLEWNNGSELKRIVNISNDLDIKYEYNDKGKRTTKEINQNKTKYFYDNDKLAIEVRNEKIIQYIRDNTGELIGFNYDGNDYFYIIDAQDSIIGILDSSLNKVVSYEYDSWGKITYVSDNTENKIGDVNPYRYRGYYYDEETDLYYLGARYYSPEIKRFISPDSTVGEIGGNPLGHNMYQYAFNNPINCQDEDGEWPKWLKKAAKAVAVVAVVAAVAAVTVATCGAGGVAATIAIGAAKGAAIGLVTGAVIGAASSVVKKRVSTGSWKGTATSALNGGANGAFSGAITGTITGGISTTVKVINTASYWEKGSFTSSVGSLDYHFKKHVVGDGVVGKNIFQYTDDALNFANRNESVLKYTFNYKFSNTSWNFKYLNGLGGEFTGKGKIITFWYLKR